MFVLDPQKPRLRKRKGSTQTCPSELLQPPLRDAQPVLPAKYRLVLWAELNLYPATFSKQYQGFIRRAFQQNPLLIQHWLRAIERDRERELWWCSLTVNSQLWARDLLQHVHEENSLSFFFFFLYTCCRRVCLRLCERQIRSRLGLLKDHEYLHYWLKWHLNEHIKPPSRTEQGMPADLAHSHPL